MLRDGNAPVQTFRHAHTYQHGTILRIGAVGREDVDKLMESVFAAGVFLDGERVLRVNPDRFVLRIPNTDEILLRVLKTGMDADLILLDFNQPHLIPCHNVLSNLVYAASGHDVVLTMVRGQILYNAGKFPTLDLAGALKELHDYAIPKVFADDPEEQPQ